MPVCTSRYISHTRTHDRATFECVFHCFLLCRSFIIASHAYSILSFLSPSSLSPALSLSLFSLFVRASHGSIIRYVSNFRLSEFFARSFRIIPAALRKKYRTFQSLCESLRGFFLSNSFSFITRNIWILHNRTVCKCTVKEESFDNGKFRQRLDLLILYSDFNSYSGFQLVDMRIDEREMIFWLTSGYLQRYRRDCRSWRFAWKRLIKSGHPSHLAYPLDAVFAGDVRYTHVHAVLRPRQQRVIDVLPLGEQQRWRAIEPERDIGR